MTFRRLHGWFAVFGLVLGFALQRIGFSDYTEIHKLFTFADLRLLFTFGGGVVIAGLIFQFIARDHNFPCRPFHKGTVPGALFFGAGWAITGACPSVVLIHIGEGKMIALASVLGIMTGTWLYAILQPRFFNWNTG